MIFEEIKKTLAEICEIDPRNIKLDDWLSQHGVDSAAGMELIIRLEEYYGITIYDDDMSGLTTVRDVTYLIAKKLSEKRGEDRPILQGADDAVEPQPKFATLAEALYTCRLASSDKGFVFFSKSEQTYIDYRTILHNSLCYAAEFQKRGVQKGHIIILALPTSLAFAQMYIAAILTGAIPCVTPTPDVGRTRDYAVTQIKAVVHQINAKFIIVDHDEADAMRLEFPDRQVWDVTQIEMWHEADPPLARISPDDIAIIQATSGSTSAPKCVALTHTNVLANLEQISERLEIRHNDVMVCWLPLFHDMGLVGCFLQALYWQLKGVFMTPFQFLRTPRLWFDAITQFKGTLSAAPNFAYGMMAKKINSADLQTVDLRSWRVAVCGAEPIDAQALRRFAHQFRDVGFNPNAMVPSYGMAEATLCITMVHPGIPINYEIISQSALSRSSRAIKIDEKANEPFKIVCDCGPVVQGTDLKVVDQSGNKLGDGEIGHILVRGPSIATYHHEFAAQSDTVAKDGWLHTGDLGYLRNNRLFVTGRSKDVIIIRGNNYDPLDFEQAAEELPEVRKGRVVAFASFSQDAGTEELIVLAELSGKPTRNITEIETLIQQHIGRRTGILPSKVSVVPHNYVPVTTSGKLQRSIARANYLVE